jgi:SAM-dependent methyltransferase
MNARRLLGVAGLATLAAALWWRKNPSACPYGQRFWVEAPHPEIFDLQQEFLDHVIARAGERGLGNVVPTQGDATALPYEDASVDAVVLTAVLGEIPDPLAALREIRRALKPDGRLVVGELFGDPHFTTRASLERQAGEAGLAFETHSGNWFAYFARLAPG